MAVSRRFIGAILSVFREHKDGALQRRHLLFNTIFRTQANEEQAHRARSRQITISMRMALLARLRLRDRSRRQIRGYHIDRHLGLRHVLARWLQ